MTTDPATPGEMAPQQGGWIFPPPCCNNRTVSADRSRHVNQSFSPAALALRILFPFALGYYLSYLFRVVNAVLAPELVRSLNLGADDLGLLTASYFITFAAFQLPLGILLDRFGSRRVEALLLLLAAAGALLFSRGETTIELVLARGLIGLGVSACLMAAFKAFTVWFDPLRLPMVNGVIMASGGLGALTATTPVQAALEVTDWRNLFVILALLTLLCAAIIYWLVPEQKRAEPETFSEVLASIRDIFRSRFFWAIAPMTMLSQSSFLAIQGLWAGPWLQDVAGLPADQGASLLFLIASAMVAGFLSLGTITSRLSHSGIPPLRIAVIGMLVFQLIQLVLLWQPTGFWMTPLWVLFGFFGTTGILVYAVLSQHFPRNLAGRVNTAINLLVFVTAFLLQSLVGYLINLWPTGEPGHYQPIAYQVSFGLLLGLQLVTLLWFFVRRPD